MRSRGVLVLASVLAVAASAALPTLRAQAPQTAPEAPAPAARPGAPLLWRIEGRVPSYLFGTIHVPDERVLALPPAVEQALDHAKALYTEIPMDPATQVGVMGKVLLPDDKTLPDVIGPELAGRLSTAVGYALPENAPAGTAGVLMSMLNRMKPWAVMSQLSLLEFLPDMMAGRKPLDAMLWQRAQQAGKQVGALETVDEQLAVFDRFSMAEQTRMLELTIAEIEHAHRTGGRSTTQQLIDTYLTGDLSALSKVMQEAMADDRELMSRFSTIAIDERNQLMAERIRARRAAEPETVFFFAVGAAHYAGPTGIVARLEKAGETVTRIR
ncbi:MAG TPA: TraB/GumN family protein [Vicinamibacterales bacterium]